jgi:uncharacterized protein YggE
MTQYKVLWAVMVMALSSPVAAVAAEIVPVRQINVTGEGRLKVKPDKAEIQFTVYAEHRILKDVKAAADAKLDASLVMLQGLGIAKGDIQTNVSSVMPRYRYESTSIAGRQTNKQVFEAYEAQHTLTVTVKKLDMVGIVLQKLADIGIDRVGNVQYGLQDERPVKEKALNEAIALARRKADIAAQALSVAVGDVLTFTESGAQYNPVPMMAISGMQMKDSEMAPASAPPAGDIEVTQSVSISYGIKD